MELAHVNAWFENYPYLWSDSWQETHITAHPARKAVQSQTSHTNWLWAQAANSASPQHPLCQTAPGQGTSRAIGITKRWETHVNKPFCSSTLQSQPCLQPICTPVNTRLLQGCAVSQACLDRKAESCRTKTDGGGRSPSRAYLPCLDKTRKFCPL